MFKSGGTEDAVPGQNQVETTPADLPRNIGPEPFYAFLGHLASAQLRSNHALHVVKGVLEIELLLSRLQPSGH